MPPVIIETDKSGHERTEVEGKVYAFLLSALFSVHTILLLFLILGNEFTDKTDNSTIKDGPD